MVAPNPYTFTIDQMVADGRVSLADIESLRDWSNAHTAWPRLADETLFIFLLSCNGSISLAQRTIEAHYRCKRQAPELFNGRDVTQPELQMALKTVFYSSLPVRTFDNHVIHFFKVNDTNYQNFELVPLMKLAYMIVELTHRHPNPPDGLVVVIDMKGIGLMHLTRIKMAAIKKFLEYLQEGMPIKMKEIHILNAVYFFDKIFNMFKRFMRNELIELLHVHSPGINMADFYQRHLPVECLPEEYGGKLASMQQLNDVTRNAFIEMRAFFENEEKARQ